MSPSDTAAPVVIIIEFALIIGGLILLWRLLSPATPRSAVLPAWDISLSDFFLFLFLVICGGVAGEYVAALYLKFYPRDLHHQLIYGTAAMHGGMLLGMAGYRIAFAHQRPRLPLGFPGALGSGAATFLVTLPVVTGVSLVWQVVLKLCHITPKLQLSVDLLRHTDSTALKAMLLFVAILVAPITEELIFRVGIFRYVRTRLPRWAALLLPALLFSLLHLDVGSFVPLVALAIVFSLAYERTGNIGTTMVAHALFNLNATLLVLAGVDT